MDSSNSDKPAQATGAVQADTAASREDAPDTKNKQGRLLRYQDILDAIEKEKEEKPVGTDFFPCKDGFYSHSLSA